jgi:hypothetical protein
MTVPCDWTTDPKLNLAWIICRMPVFGPKVDKKAGAVVQNSVMNMMTREASRRLRPKLSVPRIPNVMLNNVSNRCV